MCSVSLLLDSNVCLQLNSPDFFLFQPGSVLIAKRGGVDQGSVESSSTKKLLITSLIETTSPFVPSPSGLFWYLKRTLPFYTSVIHLIGLLKVRLTQASEKVGKAGDICWK